MPSPPAQHRAAQRDLLDGAGRLAEVDDVADAVLVLDEHEQAGDAVLDEALGAEAEGDAGDPGAGDQRGEVDAELAEHQDEGDHPDRRR